MKSSGPPSNPLHSTGFGFKQYWIMWRKLRLNTIDSLMNQFDAISIALINIGESF